MVSALFAPKGSKSGIPPDWEIIPAVVHVVPVIAPHPPILSESEKLVFSWAKAYNSGMTHFSMLPPCSLEQNVVSMDSRYR